MSLVIAEEGYLDRLRYGISGYMCVRCNHVGTGKTAYGGCLNCGQGPLYEMKTPERAHEETLAMKATQRYRAPQPEFNPHSIESQWGQALTPTQLLALLHKFNSSVVMTPTFNQFIGRPLMALYVPAMLKTGDLLSPFQAKSGLKFVCACESTVMPEWDIMPTTEDGTPTVPIRGWRSVLAIFFREGIIPFLPDDGRRRSWWELKVTGGKHGNVR